MEFAIKNLKNLLHSMQNNYIETLEIKSKHLEIVINKKNHKINLNNNTSIIQKKNNLYKNTEHRIKTNTIINQTIDINESKIYSTIISPMVGTFYQSPAPNESPFIKKGDFVEKKQIVCIIEAMKLMNEIEAEVKGEIVDILVNDGDIVDCGQALIKVKLQ
uniref:Biotin carboxyl carrier protein of acetyl-CoA carboxylase n=1 Tax=Centroceras clavulatum TaxID=159503 RepID=A0A4D6WR65_9FLOR|nr:acetyl-CoA carboxylase, biotin carboxyl carrier protein [Centroceras clavulatum]